LYQKKYQWEKADRALSKVENPILVGHFQYEKLMHPNKYKASYKELSDWFKRNTDYPPVLRKRIYYLLIKRLPEFPEIMDKANQALTYLASGQIPQNSNSYTALNTKKSEMTAFRNQSIIGFLVLVIFGLLVF